MYAFCPFSKTLFIFTMNHTTKKACVVLQGTNPMIITQQIKLVTFVSLLTHFLEDERSEIFNDMHHFSLMSSLSTSISFHLAYCFFHFTQVLRY